MQELLTEYWLELLFTAITALCTRLYTRLRTERKEMHSLKTAMCALLRDRIIVTYNRYSGKEYFPIHERENLCHLTREYYLLGGNGIVHELESRLSELPTEKGENA